MDYKVILSPRSIRDLRQIVGYIAHDDPWAAERFGYALIDAALSLAKFPERGHFVPELHDKRTREIIHYPYRIVYRIDGNAVSLLVRSGVFARDNTLFGKK